MVPPGTNRLTDNEIVRLVGEWIGKDDGYLGYPASLRFSYVTHDEFWMATCNIDANTNGVSETTRRHFTNILAGARPDQQAVVLKAILRRFPVYSTPDPDRPYLRTSTFETVINRWIERLGDDGSEEWDILASANSSVRSALDDAARLGYVRGVALLHTTMHGYLYQLCEDADITLEETNPTMVKLLKALQAEHPALSDNGEGSEHIKAVLRAMAQFLDVLNPIRNNHSAAHPLNDELAEPEAELVYNAVRTLLRYLERRRAGDWGTLEPNPAVAEAPGR